MPCIKLMHLNSSFYTNLFTFWVLNFDLRHPYSSHRDSAFTTKNFCCVAQSLDDGGTVTEGPEEESGGPEGFLFPLTSCVILVTVVFCSLVSLSVKCSRKSIHLRMLLRGVSGIISKGPTRDAGANQIHCRVVLLELVSACSATPWAYNSEGVISLYILPTWWKIRS